MSEYSRIPPRVEELQWPVEGPSRRTERQARRARRRREILVGLGVAALIWFVASLWLMWAGYRAAAEARDDLALWRSLSTTEQRSEALGSALDSLEKAEAHFGDPWLWPWRVVPVANRQIDAAGDLATAARQAASAADSGWRALASGDALAALDGDSLLDVQRELDLMHRRVLDITVPGDGWLVGPLRSAREELIDELVVTEAEIRDYASILRVFGELLASERDVVVVAANNGEMGAGVGMTLSAAPATLGGEEPIELAPFLSMVELPRPSGVQIDPDLRERYPNFDLGHIWQYTAVVTPRGPETGRMFLEMWNNVRPTPASAVLAIDSVAVSRLTALTSDGPIRTADEDIEPEGLLQWLLRGQYERYPDDNAARRAAYAVVAGQALGALTASQVDPVALAETLRSLVRGRHILVYSRDAALQQWVEDAGIGGALGNDSLALSLSNLGGNKLDSFIDMTMDVVATRNDGNVVVDIEIDLHNTATGAEVPYIAGLRNGFEPGELSSLLIVNVPRFALSADSSGPFDLYAAGPDGPASHQLAHEVRLKPGERA